MERDYNYFSSGFPITAKPLNNKDYSYAISTNQNMDIGYRKDEFSKKLLEFVKNASKNVDVNKEYRQIDLSIYGEDFDKRYYFYTNDVESSSNNFIVRLPGL